MTNFRFRGEELGVQECPSCKGNMRIKVFACRLHGTCTWAKQVFPIIPGRYQVCQMCPDLAACTGETKAEWLISSMRELRRGVKLEHRVALSPEEFFGRYWQSNMPAIFRIGEERAVRLWADDRYLVERCGGAREVEIQTGRESDPDYETRKEQHVAKTAFAEFVTRCAAGPSNDFYMTAYNAGNRDVLAPLMSDLVGLSGIIEDVKRGFFWHGPAGTVTPAHHDLNNILLSQIRGRKRFWLVAPEWHADVYNHVGVHSQVDLERVDLTRFPLMKGVPVLEGEIRPGEALFLPVGWWHQVRSLETSITIGYTNFVGRANDFAAGHPRIP